MQDAKVIEWVVGGLWALTIVMMAWTWVPSLFAAVGSTRYRDAGTEDTELAPGPREDDYAFWFDQLRERGYAPLGHGVVRLFNASERWVSETPMRVLHSKSKKWHAFVHKGDPPFDFWMFTTIATVLADGGLVMTTSAPLAEPTISDDYVRVGVPTMNFAELEEHHQKILARVRDTQPWPDSDQSLENLLRVMREKMEPSLREFHRRAGKGYLVVNAIFHGCVTLPTAWVLGLGHWGVPVSNLVLYFVMRYGQAFQDAQVARLLKERLLAMRRQQLHDRDERESPEVEGM